MNERMENSMKTKKYMMMFIMTLWTGLVFSQNDMGGVSNVGVGLNFVATHVDGFGSYRSVGPGVEGSLRYGINSPLFIGVSFGYVTVTDRFIDLNERQMTLFPSINGSLGLCFNPHSLVSIDIHSRISYFSHQEKLESPDGLSGSDLKQNLGAGWGFGLRGNITAQLRLKSDIEFMKIYKTDGLVKYRYTQFRLGFEYVLGIEAKTVNKKEPWPQITGEKKDVIAEKVTMNTEFHDKLGNRDGILDPDETGRLKVVLENNGSDRIKDLVMQVRVSPDYYKKYLDILPYPRFKVKDLLGMQKAQGELEIRAKKELPRGTFKVHIFSNKVNLSEFTEINTVGAEVDTIAPEIIITQPALISDRGIDKISSIDHSSLNLEGIVKDKNEIKYVRINDMEANWTSTVAGADFRYEIPLQMGRNVIRITAEDKFGNINEVWRLVSRENAPPLGKTFRGQRWAVVIGISNYKYTHKGIPDLRFAHRDATEFYRYLRDDQGYTEDHVRLLINEQATIMNVRDALLSFLRQAIEEDLVMIYFAGHGAPEQGDTQNLYLMCYDTDPERMPSTAYHMGDIETALERHIVSRNVIIFADACHSGGIGRNDLLTLRNTKDDNLINFYLDRLRNSGDGRVVFTASDQSQLSQESEKWGGGHGVFTYFLIKGLRGFADTNGDRIVSAGEIFGYVGEKVRRETFSQQTPRVPFGNFPWDFPLSYVRSAVVNSRFDE